MKCFFIFLFWSNFAFSLTSWKDIQDRYWQAHKTSNTKQMLHHAQQAFAYAQAQAPRYLPLSCFYLGNAFIKLNQYQQAEYYLRQAWFFWRKLYGKNNLDTLYALTLLVQVAQKQQHSQRARCYQQEITNLLKQRADYLN